MHLAHLPCRHSHPYLAVAVQEWPHIRVSLELPIVILTNKKDDVNALIEVNADSSGYISFVPWDHLTISIHPSFLILQ
jgi:hypothetical protein